MYGREKKQIYVYMYVYTHTTHYRYLGRDGVLVSILPRKRTMGLDRRLKER